MAVNGCWRSSARPKGIYDRHSSSPCRPGRGIHPLCRLKDGPSKFEGSLFHVERTLAPQPQPHMTLHAWAQTPRFFISRSQHLLQHSTPNFNFLIRIQSLVSCQASPFIIRSRTHFNHGRRSNNSPR